MWRWWRRWRRWRSSSTGAPLPKAPFSRCLASAVLGAEKESGAMAMASMARLVVVVVERAVLVVRCVDGDHAKLGSLG